MSGGRNPSRVFGLPLLAMLSLFGRAQDLGRETGLPLLVQVPTPPVPVRADGKYHLVYEIHLTSSEEPVTLLRVEAWGSGRLASLEGEQLDKAIKPAGAPGQTPARLGPMMHTVVLLWLPLDEAPSSIQHRIQGKAGNDPEPLSLESARIPVAGKPVRLRPPVRGERWVAVNGPSNNTHHRRSWLAFGGRPLVPQRYAIDFVRLNEDGSMSKGDKLDNRSYACYGAEVLAVAEARVARVKDGIPENVPGEKDKAAAMTMETMGGNYVVLDLREERYAFYGHLQPGSLRVKTGDRVRAGQVLGLVGNSGNSTGPHLHFHVSDGPAYLLSDGLPYVFDSFYRSGSLRQDEIPLENWVVDFP